MTKRLQVLLDDRDWRELKRSARAEKTTVAEWVRRAIRQARRNTSSEDIERKLAAVKAAALYTFPAPDIDQMNEEIERGIDRIISTAASTPFPACDDSESSASSPGTSNSRRG
ncbi:MAG TPA: hypothetical protein VG323_11990 [Thermoanaerobaculia bacterium]|nr:hypothetical protein [Thermoanaerobaculia bacterium]